MFCKSRSAKRLFETPVTKLIAFIKSPPRSAIFMFVFSLLNLFFVGRVREWKHLSSSLTATGVNPIKKHLV